MRKKSDDQEDAAGILVDLAKLRNQVLEAATTLAALDESIEKAEKIIRGTASGKLRLTVVRVPDRRRSPR